ncbi:MAG TPA: hypothetical protein VFW09_16315 [Solirubrobacteraceae bacterium]|nr:hypothetical protein [Solirubrobacteraceae bacterium]
MATERPAHPGRSAPGPDRSTVATLTVAAFLAVFAVLLQQLPSTAGGTPAAPLLRKVYRTTVVETVRGSRAGGAPAITRSVSSSGDTAAAPAPPASHSS